MIGCGSVAEMKSGPAFNKVPHSQLMAVMRRDEALLKEYALRHQVPQTFTNALELIHHPGIDAIYIATPPDVHEAYAIEAMREALPVFGRKIKGYDMKDALLTGVETRTSSPLKMTRGENFQSLNTQGLYPAGEGASYAGGILSAGVDGIKVAEALAQSLCNPTIRLSV